MVLDPDLTALQLSLKDALVVAVDGSAPSREALLFAADLADAAEADLHVVQVWNLVIGPWADTDEPAVEADQQAHADQTLRAFIADALGARSGQRVRVHAVHGNVKPLLVEISAVARQLIVGSRGHGDAVASLLGSISEHLVHNAKCPVTVVRPQR